MAYSSSFLSICILILGLFKLSRTKVITESSKLKSIAVPKPFTLNPSMRSDAISMMNALINRRKMPKLKRVSGMVKSTSSGFKKVFNIDKVNATSSAVVKSVISTPEIMWALINTASVDTNSLSKYRTISCLFICSFTLIFIFMMRNFLNGKNNTFTNMWFIIGVFQLLMTYN